jgi:hypothetical protein
MAGRFVIISKSRGINFISIAYWTLLVNKNKKICVKTSANKNQKMYQMNDLYQNG